MYRLLRTILSSALLAVITLSFIGCDKSFEQGARENTAAFFRTVNRMKRNQVADPYHLSQKSISILDDRLFIQLPEGAEIMSEKQRKSLRLPQVSNSMTEQYLMWSGNGEILVLYISDWLVGGSGNIEQDARKSIEVVGRDLFSVHMPDIEMRHPFALLNYHNPLQTREGETHILRALTTSVDGLIMQLDFSIYTTKFEQLDQRIAYFQKVSEQILMTLAPGTRMVGAEEQKVIFEQFAFTIPAGYCVTQNDSAHKKSNGDKQNARIDVEPIVPLGTSASFFIMEIGETLTATYPESVAESQEDLLLGHPVAWQRQQGTTPSGYAYDFWETVVPIVGRKGLKISLYPQQENDLQELLDIIHTLEKK